MSVQSKSNRRKRALKVLQDKSAAGTVSQKEIAIMHKVELAASSTLNKAGLTAIEKLLYAMTPNCCIYDVNSKLLLRKTI